MRDESAIFNFPGVGVFLGQLPTGEGFAVGQRGEARLDGGGGETNGESDEEGERARNGMFHGSGD